MPFYIEVPMLRMELTENGVDSFVEAIDRFESAAGPLEYPTRSRDLKFAILHLAQAVELLLKARLAKEHRLLIYTDPAKAGSDTARTVDFADLVARLQAAGIGLGDLKDVRDLQAIRNNIQHHRIDIYQDDAEALLRKAILFLQPFAARELEIDLFEQITERQRSRVKKALCASHEEAAQIGLQEIEALQAAGKIDPNAKRLVCDLCDQQTVLVPDPTVTTFQQGFAHCWTCGVLHPLDQLEG